MAGQAHKKEETGESEPQDKAGQGEHLTRAERYLVAAAFILGALLVLYNALVNAPIAPPKVVQADVLLSTSEPQDTSVAEPARADGKLQPGETINLNTATEAELMRRPGIGEKRAAAIWAYRETAGPFDAVEDLVFVDGISDKLMQQIKPYLRLE